MRMTRNEWICRDCEDSPDDIVIDGITRMQEIDHETEELYLKDSICSVVYATRVCDRCQVVKVCYKRKTMLAEAVSEAPEPLEPELEVVAVLEEVVEEIEETNERETEIARLKAQLAELEK